MKKLIALSLATSSIAFGECDNCCEPCYAYTAPFYDLECDWGFFLTADFLYWYGKDDGLTYSLKTQSAQIVEMTVFDPSFINLPTKICDVEEEWDPGFRVGIGWNSSCDGWDYYLHWTYFANSSKNSESVPPFENGVENDLLINPWSNPLFGSDFHFEPFDQAFYGFSAIYTSIQSKWKERLNIIDAELGRKFWLSPCMSLRPFFGVRGAWDRNRFKVSSLAANATQGVIAQDTTRFKNNYWGLGIVGGLQPNWYFSRCFSLFGNLDAALLWGQEEMKRKESIADRLIELDTVSINIPDTFYKSSGMLAIIDLAIGLRFESDFCCNRYHLALDLGWEQHVWFNHHQRFQFNDGFGGLSRDSGFTELQFVSAEYSKVDYNFVFGGGVVRLRFDF